MKTRPRRVMGVTGSRLGMTDAQHATVERFLIQWASQVHHGDCIGVDALVHALALHHQVPVVLHPPDKDTSRAFSTGAAKAFEARPYLERDREIVEACDFLVGVPRGPERARSGTWYTIRYAIKSGRETYVVHLDGRVSHVV